MADDILERAERLLRRRTSEDREVTCQNCGGHGMSNYRELGFKPLRPGQELPNYSGPGDVCTQCGGTGYIDVPSRRSSRSEVAQRKYTGHIQRLRTHLGNLQDFANRYPDTVHGQKMSKIAKDLQHSLKYVGEED